MKKKFSHNSSLSKLVKKFIDQEYIPKSNEFISKVIEICSNYLLKVETEHGGVIFLSVPTKFRNIIYIAVGMFVVAEPVVEGDKVKGILVAILYEKHIRFLISENKWPKIFENSCKPIKKDFTHLLPLSSSSSTFEDDMD